MNLPEGLIVVGYAKVSAASAAHNTHRLFSLCLLVDPGTGRVLAADATAETTVVRRWVADLLLGADLTADPAPLLATVERNYLGQGAGAIRQAITDAWRRYARHREE
ncbi:DUF3870 domain-containing protein [Amycolatopsis plumensis]|uniref:DUF3870 domain-containing protein n=2 Tax=Amycolatopsis plumensis TaxID=236508 RepID=A0ABV5UIE5_9PSEU